MHYLVLWCNGYEDTYHNIIKYIYYLEMQKKQDSIQTISCIDASFFKTYDQASAYVTKTYHWLN